MTAGAGVEARVVAQAPVPPAVGHPVVVGRPPPQALLQAGLQLAGRGQQEPQERW